MTSQDENCVVCTSPTRKLAQDVWRAAGCRCVLHVCDSCVSGNSPGQRGRRLLECPSCRSCLASDLEERSTRQALIAEELRHSNVLEQIARSHPRGPALLAWLETSAPLSIREAVTDEPLKLLQIPHLERMMDDPSLTQLMAEQVNPQNGAPEYHPLLDWLEREFNIRPPCPYQRRYLVTAVRVLRESSAHQQLQTLDPFMTHADMWEDAFSDSTVEGWLAYHMRNDMKVTTFVFQQNMRKIIAAKPESREFLGKVLDHGLKNPEDISKKIRLSNGLSIDASLLQKWSKEGYRVADWAKTIGARPVGNVDFNCV